MDEVLDATATRLEHARFIPVELAADDLVVGDPLPAELCQRQLELLARDATLSPRSEVVLDPWAENFRSAKGGVAR